MISLVVIVYKKILIRSESLAPVSQSNLDIKETIYFIILVSTFLCGLTLLPNTIPAVDLIIPVATAILFSVSVFFCDNITRNQQKAKNSILDLSLLKNCHFTYKPTNNDYRNFFLHNLSNSSNTTLKCSTSRIWWRTR